MTSWNTDTVRQHLDRFLGTGDPADPKERRRRRLLQAATDLFVLHGYRRTSMEEVAREAGVAKGTVYLYFKNKSELLLHAVGEEKRRYLDEMRSIFDGSASPRERLKRWIHLALVLGATMPLTSRLLSGDKEMLAALDAFYAGSGKEFEQMKFDFLGQMVADVAGRDRFTRGELEDRANVLYGLAFFAGTAADERIRSGLSLARFAELLAGMVVDGVAGSKGERA